MTNTMIQEIAALLLAIANCEKSGNAEWKAKHSEKLNSIVRERMPSGSGIDNGTHLMPDSTPERVKFRVLFHHMDSNGFYNGWTEHTITARPSFVHGVQLTISGRDRNDIKEYLGEVYQSALTQDS